jgi:hypothetical protein
MKQKYIIIIMLVMIFILAGCGGTIEDESMPIFIAGEIQEISEFGNSILVYSEAETVKGLIWIGIDENTIFHPDVNRDFNVGNFIEIGVVGGIAESYPMQAHADYIYDNEMIIEQKDQLNNV